MKQQKDVTRADGKSRARIRRLTAYTRKVHWSLPESGIVTLGRKISSEA